MNPSMKTVMRTRYWVRFAWRLAIALILFWGLWSIRSTVSMILFKPFEQTPFGAGPGVFYWLVQAASTLTAYIVVAGVMLATERFVVRWLAPNPHRGCGNCGYPTPSRAGPCAECGFNPAK